MRQEGEGFLGSYTRDAFEEEKKPAFFFGEEAVQEGFAFFSGQEQHREQGGLGIGGKGATHRERHPYHHTEGAYLK